MKRSIREHLKTCVSAVRTCYRAAGSIVFWNYLLSALIALLPFISAAALKEITNELAALAALEQPMNRLIFFGACYIAVLLIRNTLTGFQAYSNQIIEEKTTRSVTDQIVKKSTEVEIAYFDRAEYYDQLSIALRFANNVYYLYKMLGDIALSIITVVMTIVLLLDIDLRITMILVMIQIPMLWIQLKNAKRELDTEEDSASDNRRIQYFFSIGLEKQYAKDVRISPLEHLVKRKMDAYTASFLRKQNNMLHKNAAKGIIGDWISYLAMGIALVLAVLDAMHGAISIGDIQYAMNLILLSSGRLENLTVDLAYLKGFLTRVAKYLSFIQTAAESRLHWGSAELDELRSIRFEHVFFRYPNAKEYALQDVSFELRAGERVMLAGLNGAGKSTIVKLLLGLYPAESGEILLNGKKISAFAIEDIRSKVGIFFQDTALYAFTLAENVHMWAPGFEKDEAKLAAALAQSGVSRMIQDWPMGENTDLTKLFSEDGRELSGGQAQKIASARALYHGADFLILDEPSSSLDAKSEEEIFKNAIALSKDRGCLLVSHRLSVSRMMDTILFLEHGRIAECGSHEQLLKKNGRYAHLYRLQADSYQW